MKSITQNKTFAAILAVLLGLAVFVLAVEFVQKMNKKNDGPQGAVVTWNDLYEFDYKKNIASDKLKKIDGTKIRIAGYVVPLSDDYFVLSEFLLVPNAQACIHVPPPPPNLIVHVKLADPLPVEKVFNPAWIEGVLEIKETKSIHGAASFKMDDATLEEYKY